MELLTVQRDKQRVLVTDSRPIAEGYYFSETDTYIACSDGTVFVVYGADEVDVVVRGRSFDSCLMIGKVHGVRFSSPLHWFAVVEEHNLVREPENITTPPDA